MAEPDRRRGRAWLWDGVVPVALGTLGAWIWYVRADAASPELAWLVAMGGAASGAVVSAALWTMRDRAVGAPVGMVWAILVPVMSGWALQVSVVLGRGAPLEVPDRQIAVLWGVVAGLFPPLTLGVVVLRSSAGAWFRGAAAGVALLAIAATHNASRYVSPRRHWHQRTGASCRSNCTQLSIALSLYADDHAGRFPPSLQFAESVGIRQAWPYATRPAHFTELVEVVYGGGYLMPYTKTARPWICPQDPGVFDRIARVRPDFVPGPGVSYRWNAGLAARPVEAVGGPAITPMVFDRGPFHRNGRHVGFVDGHVKWTAEADFAEWGLDAR